VSKEVDLTAEQWAGFVGIGAGVPALAGVAIEATLVVTTTVLANPATVATVQKVVSDFTLGATPGSPPPTNWTGLAGAATSRAIDTLGGRIGPLKNKP